MTADDLYAFLESVPSRLAGTGDDRVTEDRPASWADLNLDLDAPPAHADVRRRLLDVLGYDPADVSVVDPEGGDRGRIVAGLPVVDHDLPTGRRFVLRVGEDPAVDPPVPDQPEALVYPTLRLVRETLADAGTPVDYALQLTDARLVIDGEDVSRTYVLPGVAADAADELPSFEALTRETAADLYAWLAVDAAAEDQTSIAEF